MLESGSLGHCNVLPISLQEDQVKVSRMVQAHSMGREITHETFLFFTSCKEFAGTPTDVPIDRSVSLSLSHSLTHTHTHTHARTHGGNIYESMSQQPDSHHGQIYRSVSLLHRNKATKPGCGHFHILEIAEATGVLGNQSN
jgi:hypothetical protein